MFQATLKYLHAPNNILSHILNENKYFSNTLFDIKVVSNIFRLIIQNFIIFSKKNGAKLIHLFWTLRSLHF